MSINPLGTPVYYQQQNNDSSIVKNIFRDFQRHFNAKNITTSDGMKTEVEAMLKLPDAVVCIKDRYELRSILERINRYSQMIDSYFEKTNSETLHASAPENLLPPVNSSELFKRKNSFSDPSADSNKQIRRSYPSSFDPLPPSTNPRMLPSPTGHSTGSIADILNGSTSTLKNLPTSSRETFPSNQGPAFQSLMTENVARNTLTSTTSTSSTFSRPVHLHEISNSNDNNRVLQKLVKIPQVEEILNLIHMNNMNPNNRFSIWLTSDYGLGSSSLIDYLEELFKCQHRDLKNISDYSLSFKRYNESLMLNEKMIVHVDISEYPLGNIHLKDIANSVHTLIVGAKVKLANSKSNFMTKKFIEVLLLESDDKDVLKMLQKQISDIHTNLLEAIIFASKLTYVFKNPKAAFTLVEDLKAESSRTHQMISFDMLRNLLKRKQVFNEKIEEKLIDFQTSFKDYPMIYQSLAPEFIKAIINFKDSKNDQFVILENYLHSDPQEDTFLIKSLIPKILKQYSHLDNIEDVLKNIVFYPEPPQDFNQLKKAEKKLHIVLNSKSTNLKNLPQHSKIIINGNNNDIIEILKFKFRHEKISEDAWIKMISKIDAPEFKRNLQRCSRLLRSACSDAKIQGTPVLATHIEANDSSSVKTPTETQPYIQ